MFKKFLVPFLLTVMTYQGTQAMSGKPDEFRFEDYKTGEEAQTALLQLHPIGSDVGALVKTLEGVGAGCKPSADKRYKNAILCGYIEKEIVFGTEWQIGIFRPTSDSNQISDLKVYSHFQSL